MVQTSPLSARHGNDVFVLHHSARKQALELACQLGEFAANPRWLGGIGAFTLVLHTGRRTCAATCMCTR